VGFGRVGGGVGGTMEVRSLRTAGDDPGCLWRPDNPVAFEQAMKYCEATNLPRYEKRKKIKTAMAMAQADLAKRGVTANLTWFRCRHCRGFHLIERDKKR
jgi:hypothetical protein